MNFFWLVGYPCAIVSLLINEARDNSKSRLFKDSTVQSILQRACNTFAIFPRRPIGARTDILPNRTKEDDLMGMSYLPELISLNNSRVRVRMSFDSLFYHGAGKWKGSRFFKCMIL